MGKEMTASKLGSLVLLCVLAPLGAVTADCVRPSPSPIPDGTTATEQEMVAAMKAFKQYDALASAYVKCLEAETAAQIARSSGERQLLKQKQMSYHNAAIDELQAAAGRFNKQVRIYKERAKS